MAELSLNIADVAAVIAAIATSIAALAAFRSARSAKHAVDVHRESEKSRLELQKKEVLIQRFQLLLADFAEISALAHEEHSQERGIQLRHLDMQIRRHCSVISYLSSNIGEKLQEWRTEEVGGYCNAQLLSHILGSLNAGIGNKHKDFFEHKSKGLLRIQELIFSL
ncbi:hypothetical protein [Halomonas sp. AOP43-D1-4]|uniref:hypothetical protein n=1 Tax=Halomonas sp. AOP43-D1-4 TaxID=3457658 RepID=UPI0040335209